MSYFSLPLSFKLFEEHPGLAKFEEFGDKEGPAHAVSRWQRQCFRFPLSASGQNPLPKRESSHGWTGISQTSGWSIRCFLFEQSGVCPSFFQNAPADSFWVFASPKLLAQFTHAFLGPAEPGQLYFQRVEIRHGRFSKWSPLVFQMSIYFLRTHPPMLGACFFVLPQDFYPSGFPRSQKDISQKPRELPVNRFCCGTPQYLYMSV